MTSHITALEGAVLAAWEEAGRGPLARWLGRSEPQAREGPPALASVLPCEYRWKGDTLEPF